MWVALVVQELKSCTADELIGRVEQIPTDLDGLYTGMLVNMIKSKFATHCKKVLLVMTNAYRPLHLSELIGLANLPIESDQEQIVRRCGFLALGDDNSIAYFVHQSAKDYLVQGGGPEILSCVFPNGHIEGHHMIVTQSLECMNQLQRDIDGLERPGFCIDELKGCKDDSLLEPLRYSCVYWADHLCASSAGYQTISLRDDGPINEFWKTRLLYWLEALSLMGNYSVAVYTSIKLVKMISVSLSFFPVVDHTNTGLTRTEFLTPITISELDSGLSSIYPIVSRRHREIPFTNLYLSTCVRSNAQFNARKFQKRAARLAYNQAHCGPGVEPMHTNLVQSH